jgi:hypothetical protein
MNRPIAGAVENFTCLIPSPMLNYLASEQVMGALRAVLFLLVGFVLARVVSRLVQRLMVRRFSVHHAMVFRRLAFYLILALFVASALNELGFSLGVLLGAAGVLSVAIGFASQTSASNLISGLFLIGERPFGAGDVIKVGDTTGEVLSVDLLSVKAAHFRQPVCTHTQRDADQERGDHAHPLSHPPLRPDGGRGLQGRHRAGSGGTRGCCRTKCTVPG